MRYGAILSESWKALWRSWALWGFLATWLAVSGVAMLAVLAGLAALFATAFAGATPDVAAVAGFSGLAALVGLALVPAYWLFHAGAIHLSNEALSGRPVRFADGFAAGRRRFAALGGFELVFYGIMLAVGLVIAALFAVLVGGIIASAPNGPEEAAFSVIGGVCCFYIVIFAFSIAAALIVQGFEAVGARAAVLSGRRGMEAFGDAWQALRRSFKSVVVMGLIVIGLTWAYSMVTSVVTAPLQFLATPQLYSMDPTAIETDPTAFLGMFGLAYVAIIALSFALNFPPMVYFYLVWTGFYRQLVGIVPAEQPISAPVSPGYVPAPPVSQQLPGAIPPPPPPPAPIPPQAIPQPPSPRQWRPRNRNRQWRPHRPRNRPHRRSPAASDMTSAGRLSVCATPIGNLGDITLRVLDVLKSADLIAAEDTRVTRKLLSRYEIHTPLEAYHAHNVEQRTPELVDRIGAGAHIALVSDAGTPGISDPGAVLVEACLDAGLAVDVLPGANAIVTALVASGLPTHAFYFGGFLPRKIGERRRRFEALVDLEATLVFYESPHRTGATLAALAEVFPGRAAAVARELTKLHEEVARDEIAALAASFENRELKGEVVILVGPPARERAMAIDEDGIRTRVAFLVEAGTSRSDAVKQVAEEIGLGRNAVYEIALTDGKSDSTAE